MQNLLLTALIMLGTMVPALAMDPSEKEIKKMNNTCQDLKTARQILQTARSHAPITPQKRHVDKLDQAIQALDDQRDSMPDEAYTPLKKRYKTTYEWSPDTDPNVRAFPTVRSILHKPSVRRSIAISPEAKENATHEIDELIELYNEAPHKKAVKDARAAKVAQELEYAEQREAEKAAYEAEKAERAAQEALDADNNDDDDDDDN